jgi:fused signal recognition particle receptor
VERPDQIRPALERRARQIMEGVSKSAPEALAAPHVILVVGVNGAGKTTSIGKLAARLVGQGRSVLLAAADTYRAAAIDQLEIWAERAGAEIVKGEPGGDPASVAFEALKVAQARAADVVIVDTSGRMQTDAGLMDELSKMVRVIRKQCADAPHEVLLALDANTGQNAIRQAQEFARAVDVTGIVLSKLDGTAKGGVVLGITGELGIPVRYVGMGEGIEDLYDFDAGAFARALFEGDSA